MIKVENLTKSYGAIQALRGVSFEIDAGEIVGLLGPNGAGKSTTIKILTGYIHPDGGQVTVDSCNVLTHPLDAQSRIGYLSENTPLYPALSVQSYLKLMAELRLIPAIDQLSAISEAIYATGLEQYRTRPIGQLSKGLRQRVGIAQAILHKPPVIILDEPTIGLDPMQIIEIRRLIQRLAQHSTILLSSHILGEVETVCNRVIIITNGQVRTNARLNELSATMNTILVLQTSVDDAIGHLSKVNNVEKVEAFENRDGYPAFRIVSQTDIATRIYDLACAENWPLRELRYEVVTLESIFNSLVRA